MLISLWLKIDLQNIPISKLYPVTVVLFAECSQANSELVELITGLKHCLIDHKVLLVALCADNSPSTLAGRDLG